MTPMRARSRSPLSSVTSMESNSCRAWSADRTGVLPRFTTYLGPRTCAGRVRRQDATGNQIVEKLPDGGQMLFDRRLGHHDAELLNVGSHGRWPDSVQLQASVLAPIKELSNRQGIGHPGVTVPDVGGEELDEALAGARAGRRDRGRQHVDAGANERRRRRDHVISGQNYGFLWLFRHWIRRLLTLPLLPIIKQ